MSCLAVFQRGRKRNLADTSQTEPETKWKWFFQISRHKVVQMAQRYTKIEWGYKEVWRTEIKIHPTNNGCYGKWMGKPVKQRNSLCRASQLYNHAGILSSVSPGLGHTLQKQGPGSGLGQWKAGFLAARVANGAPCLRDGHPTLGQAPSSHPLKTKQNKQTRKTPSSSKTSSKIKVNEGPQKTLDDIDLSQRYLGYVTQWL